MKPNGIKRTGKTIYRLLRYIYSISPKHFILNLFFTILMGFTSALSVWATKILINGIAEASGGEDINFLGILALFAIINISIQLIRSLNGYMKSKHQIKIDYKMSMDILEKCRDLTLQDFEDSETYNVLSKAEMEGSTKVYTSYTNILSIITQLASIVSVSALILTWNSYLFLLIFITPIISTFVNTRIGYLNYKMRMQRMGEVRKTSYINYLLTNDIACKEIKAYNIGSYLIDIFSNVKKKIQRQDLKITKKRTVWDIGLNLIDELISLFIIFNVVNMAAMGRILIGDTVAYIDSLSIIQGNVGGFLRSLSEIYNDIMYVDQFYYLLDLEVKENTDGTIEIDEIKEIEFKNVSYAYKGSSNNTLADINLKMKIGEMIGIVGENGSGKTTFIKLLCGFYPDYQGEILINGIELRKINPNSLRQKMGIIFQDFNKYELTLRNNIGFGDIKQMDNDDKIIGALDKINLKEKIYQFPERIDTQMGKWFGGEELSKGQWQRIALGRAFIREADLYILDEPTASLDPISEKDIFNLMLDKSKGKICLFITHRLENIIACNPRIIVFSEGKIVGDGSHKDLDKRNRAYEKLLGA